ncbi:hypothetical protein PCASD_19571, partial [Puccinia coronata f. sp. avenae]
PTSQFINPQFSLDEEAEQLDTLDPESLATVMSLKRKEESAAHHDRRKFIKVLVDPVTSLSAADENENERTVSPGSLNESKQVSGSTAVSTHTISCEGTGLWNPAILFE